MSQTTLFTGRIWSACTGDLDALLVDDGRVVATGDRARERASEIGAVEHEVPTLLLPAFGDGHAHPLFGGLESEGPAIRECTSVEEIVAEVARYAAAHPDLDVIRGASYDASLVDGGLFDARWLDEAAPGRPVVLRAWDYHTVWVSTATLERCGITAQTPDPPLGEIARRPDGSPLGTLREWGAVDLVTDVLGEWDVETMVRSVERAGRAYAALGVTWVQDAWVTPAELPAWLRAAREDRLPVRFDLALHADPRRWPDQLGEILAMREQVRALGHPRLRAESVKFFADGVVENATAALLEPYATLLDGSRPEEHAACGCPVDGMMVWPPEQLAEAVTAVDAHGLQPHIHAIGDRAVRAALDAVGAAEAANGPRDRRAVVAHVQLVDPADRARFAELGVIANAEPLWAQLDDLMTVLTVPRLGQPRVDEQYCLADLHALGTPLSFGSDWPVSSADPLEGMAVACSRQTQDRVPEGGWVPEQRLPVEAALAAYTLGSAHQARRDAGCLDPGCVAGGPVADLVELTADPRDLPSPRDIDGIRVRRTWLAGRAVHPSPAADEAGAPR
ncbi:amidohydrolase family protein [Janibacter melonis]|uniref:Amidohydrolase family protein n=1 Tax=Janibacter melonis TaxID=262209 RepID=A0A5P8FMF4_9MICO|nr:amidohydrolase [Janibacter melonis]QFQ30508.2 amidohydrolase family protein [Janibacter melonis]